MSIARWNLKEAGSKALPLGTRTASGISCRMSLLNKTKSKNYTDTADVNDAGAWKESYVSYPERAHGRIEMHFKIRTK